MHQHHLHHLQLPPAARGQPRGYGTQEQSQTLPGLRARAGRVGPAACGGEPPVREWHECAGQSARRGGQVR